VGTREDRIARNETLFRDVNERVRELAAGFSGAEPGTVAFVCECGQGDCAESIGLRLDAYERVREDPTHFVIVPGHETPEVESIVEQHEGYDIVRKRAGEEQIAIETDPRS
jgi:hypothetical protein